MCRANEIEEERVEEHLHDAGENSGSLAYVMREAVGAAIAAIRAQKLHGFEAQEKRGYDGVCDDVVTTADKKAQELYLSFLREAFPDYRIIAEEDELRVEPQNGCTTYFTIDPLDGTKAFVRGQSHGVGTMIACVENGQVLAAFIGDVNTQEVCGYTDEGPVTITYPEGVSRELGYCQPWVKGRSRILLFNRKRTYSRMSARLVGFNFETYNHDSGGIGVMMMRLWRREVAAVLLNREYDTPWDMAPVIGICRKLGYVFYKPGYREWLPHTMNLCEEKYYRDHEMLIIHQNDRGIIENT